MINIWRQIRLAGAVVLLLALVFHNLALLTIGFMSVAVGVVNGLYFLELKVEKLEEELRHANTETPKGD